MIFYISDLHLNDQDIFEKCKRPFKSLEEMEKVIIDNWNSVVTNNDEVYVLGDIGTTSNNKYLTIFKKLNGKKHLIIGNHDDLLIDDIKISKIFETISFIKEIKDCGRKVCLCHYPLMDWIEFNRGGILIYGHIHNKTENNGLAYRQIKQYYKDKLAFNCGVDVTGFKPVTLEQMIYLKEKNINEAYIN